MFSLSRMLQDTARKALEQKYGYGPKRYKDVLLLEGSGDGSYILFRVGDVKYRLTEGVLERYVNGEPVQEL